MAAADVGFPSVVTCGTSAGIGQCAWVVGLTRFLQREREKGESGGMPNLGHQCPPTNEKTLASRERQLQAGPEKGKRRQKGNLGVGRFTERG